MPTRARSATASGATSSPTTSRVADALNASGDDVVSIQHEYGIWGGDDGAYVLDFVRALRRPVVTTLHTVLRHADARPAARS